MAITPTLGAPGCATNIPLLTGPLLLGYMFSYGLFGVLCVQVFMYHIAFPNDPRWLKAYVLFSFAIEVVLVVLTSNSAWFALGAGFGDLSRILNFDRTTVAQPALSALATSLFHGLYCWRIYGLTHSLVIPIVAGAISALQFSVTVYIGVYWGQQKESVRALHHVHNLIIVWLLGAAVVDVIITSTLVINLVKYRRNSIDQSTVSKIYKLIMFTVETGLATTCVAIATLVVYLSSQETFFCFTLFYILAKVYSNTLMASLNSRMILNMNSGAIRTDCQMSSLVF